MIHDLDPELSCTERLLLLREFAKSPDQSRSERPFTSRPGPLTIRTDGKDLVSSDGNGAEHRPTEPSREAAVEDQQYVCFGIADCGFD